MEIVFDVLVLVIVLALGAPLIAGAYTAVVYEQNYGFGTLSDKSIVSSAAQQRQMYGNAYVKDYRLLTPAHVYLMPVVDDRVRGDAAAIIQYIASGEVYASPLSMATYSLAEYAKYSQYDLFSEGLAGHDAVYRQVGNVIPGVPWGTYMYHAALQRLNIGGTSGSIVVSTDLIQRNLLDEDAIRIAEEG
jgi:hypothetical protein